MTNDGPQALGSSSTSDERQVSKEPKIHPKRFLSEEEIQKEMAEFDYWLEHPKELRKQIQAKDPTYRESFCSLRLGYIVTNLLDSWS